MRLRALQEQGRLKSDGTVAEITLADGTVYQTKGVITFIDKQVNTNTSVVAARAEFVNPDLSSFPASSCASPFPAWNWSTPSRSRSRPSSRRRRQYGRRDRRGRQG